MSDVIRACGTCKFVHKQSHPNLIGQTVHFCNWGPPTFVLNFDAQGQMTPGFANPIVPPSASCHRFEPQVDASNSATILKLD